MDFASLLIFQFPHALAFWSVLAWTMVMEAVQVKRKLDRAGGHAGDDAYSGLVISVGGGVLQLAAFAVAAYGHWRFPAENLVVVFYAGLALVVGAMLLRIHCWRVLGHFFTHTVTIASDHHVVDNGAYRFVRHPSYLGALLAFFGLGLTLGNYGSLILLVVGSWAIYIYRIEVEERALEAALGDSYRAFKKTRKRVIPFVY
jgi:protein-S-isoprenylcysteine O-methyltransferase Ste14